MACAARDDPDSWPLSKAGVPHPQRAMIAALAALLLFAQVKQPFPEVAPLHHIPTLLLLVAAPFLLRRWPMSNASVALIALFFALHTIGGRYTYSNVPYDDLARALTGRTISDMFGFTRNHYDRLVHFSYGLLAVAPISEALRRHVGIGSMIALYVAVESVLAVSLLYELFEWQLAMIMQGPLADAYNGQQGDIWDSQKDMALAALGAIMAALAIQLRRRRRRSDER
jgi:putative membrane protein